jgi:hypothetical protein
MTIPNWEKQNIGGGWLIGAIITVYIILFLPK